MIRQSKVISRNFRSGSRALVTRAVVSNLSSQTSSMGTNTAYPFDQFSKFGSVRFASTTQQGIVPEALDAAQTRNLVELLKNPPKGEEDFLMNLLENRISPGVDEAAYVKAAFLAAVTKGEAKSPLVNAEKATELLGTMQGGYNIITLVELLNHPKLAEKAADGLSRTILMFDAFHDVEAKAKKGNKAAQRVIQSWADAEWLTKRDSVAEKITVFVLKTNTGDEFRLEIPLHALAMLKKDFALARVSDEVAQFFPRPFYHEEEDRFRIVAVHPPLLRRALLDPTLPTDLDLKYLYARLTRVYEGAKGLLSLHAWRARWDLHGVTSTAEHFFRAANLEESSLNGMRAALEMYPHDVNPEHEPRIEDLAEHIEKHLGGDPIKLEFQ